MLVVLIVVIVVAVSGSLSVLLHKVVAVEGASFNFTCVYALGASLAYPEHPGSLEIMSKTLAATICDAEAPCSVITA